MDSSERPQPTVRNDLSFPMGKANLYSLLFFIPALILISFYRIIWGEPYVFLDVTVPNILKLFAIFVFGIVLHEVIHGLTWMYFSKKSFASLKFGFQWKTLTPYAHSREPMEVHAYRLGAMMPGLVLGVLPYLLGMITGNAGIMFFGVIFTWSASGDALVLWSIRGVQPGQLVEDHPTRCGCYAIESRRDENLTSA